MRIVWKYRTLLVAALIFVCNSLIAQEVINIPVETTTAPGLSPEGATPVDSPVVRKSFMISKIFVFGNRKTKDYIIKRELPFQEGDSVVLNELVAKFRLGKRQLINTRLFNDVVISLKSFRGYLVDVQIDVKERWYIFPIPYLKPIDRNLQTWAQKGYSLDRVNYGAKFNYYNATGRNDVLKLWLITGYSRQIQASYNQPFMDGSLKSGFGFNFSYAAMKEVNPLTVNDQQFFLKADSLPKAGRFLEEQWGGSIQWNYRTGLRTRHVVRLGFYMSKVDSAVLAVNPNYFSKTGKSQIAYPELSYTVSHVDIDYAPYPLRGQMWELNLARRGLGKDVGMWTFSAKGTRAWEMKWKSSFSSQVFGTLRLPFNQPFMHHRMFGYGDFYLRGLEKYVIDGVAAAMSRNTFRRELFNFHIPLPIRSTSHDRIPFRIYAKTYADFAYSHNKQFNHNFLNNKLLSTAGAGIDIVTLYDVVMRFEYSFNQMGQKGFFFHFKNDF